MRHQRVYDILLDWLKQKQEVATHDIETKLPEFGELLFDVRYTPGTYSRAWRSLREDQSLLREYGLSVIKIDNPHSKEKSWLIRRVM